MARAPCCSTAAPAYCTRTCKSVSPVLLGAADSLAFFASAKAVREMGKEESVEVVDVEDVADFLSARAGKKAGGIA